MSTTTPEQLLGHADFVRRLSRSLLYDPADADDVAQQTWLATLERAPEALRHPKGYLATVVRHEAANLRRGEGRRAARQESVATPEATRSTADVLEREELRRRVVRAVLALAEPYRTAVLLRYFDDLPPREIAARLEQPLETIKSRIKRGLRRLREALDAKEERAHWGFALIALAGWPDLVEAAPAAGAPAPAAIGTRTTWRIGSVAAAALVGLVWWATHPANTGDAGGHAGPAFGTGAAGGTASGGSVGPARPNAGTGTDAAAGGGTIGGPNPDGAAGVGESAPAAAETALRGTVVDADGAPVPDATVRAFVGIPARRAPWAGTNAGLREACAPHRLQAETHSDAQGAFRFGRDALPPGIYELHADQVGRATGFGAAEIVPDVTATTTLRLSAPAPLSGRVVDAGGRGCAGMIVRASTNAEGIVATYRLFTTTNADGAFTFEAAPAAEYQLYQRGGDHPWHVSPVVRAPAADITLRALEPMLIVGTVTDGRTGEPVPHAELCTGYHARAGFSGGWETARADDQGRFRIRASADADTVTLYARADGYATASQVFAGRPGAVRVDVAFRPGRLTGRLCDATDRTPIAGATVYVSTHNDAAIFYGGGPTATTDADGGFVLRGLPVRARPGDGPVVGTRPGAGAPADGGGTYPTLFLVVEAAGYRLPELRAIQVVSGGDAAHVDLLLERAAQVAGQVLDEAGAPVVGAEVGVQSLAPPPGTPAFAAAVERGAVRTDAAGRFRLSHVPGTDGVRLVVRHDTHVPACSDPLALRAGERLDGQRIVLRAGRSLTAHVRDTAGHGVAGLLVTLDPTGSGTPADREPALRVRRVARTDPSGTVHLRGLPVGAYRLRAGTVADSEFLAQRREVSIGADADAELTVELPRGYPVAGRFVDPEGRPVPHLVFWVGPATVNGYTDAEGRFALRLVPVTPQPLRLSGPWALADPQQTLAGGRTEVVIRVRPTQD